MDTNSLVYDIKTEDFYEGIAGNIKTRLDMSGSSHSQVCPLPIGVNKEVIGLMKEERSRRIMTEFVALKLKLYTYKTLRGSGDKKCKGVEKCVVKMLNFDDYKQCLFAGENMFHNQLMFQNDLPKGHMVEVNELALSRDDNK